MTVGPMDLMLLIVVSLQATVLAYLHAPRWKALLLTLPFPFTFITLALGRPMDATNATALLVLFFYVQSIRLLYQRLRVPIVPAIALSVAGYCTVGWVLARTLPLTTASFWGMCAVVFAFGLVLHLTMPIRLEPGYRTPLPLWKKLPVIIAVICFLILIKSMLKGFSTLFPILGIVGVYEARYSLWTVGRQIPVLMLTLIPLMVVSRLTWHAVGLAPSIALGWIAFLCVLALLIRPMWARWNTIQAQAPEAPQPAGRTSS